MMKIKYKAIYHMSTSVAHIVKKIISLQFASDTKSKTEAGYEGVTQVCP